MIISISGKVGSGKSSVGEILSKRLKMKRYSMGQLRRDMARDMGITINELNKLGEKEDFTDKKVDEFAEKLGKTQDNFIIEGRTMFHFIPHSIKVFLDVESQEGARRIFNESKEMKEKRNEEEYESVEELKKHNIERMKSDTRRYKKYYGIDPYDKKNFDFILDTTNLTIKEAVEKVLGFIKTKSS